ncbi:hypothetical protein GGF32_009606 [Allomyces javanicus]|nr:hypothetical protein GGF32_009606 [Allomyces javanicus]
MLAVNMTTNAPTASSARPPPATAAADVPCRTFAEFLDHLLADLPADVPVTLYDVFAELEQYQTLYGVALLANADIDRYLAMAEHVQILHEEFLRDQIALALHEVQRCIEQSEVAEGMERSRSLLRDGEGVEGSMLGESWARERADRDHEHDDGHDGRDHGHGDADRHRDQSAEPAAAHDLEALWADPASTAAHEHEQDHDHRHPAAADPATFPPPLPSSTVPHDRHTSTRLSTASTSPTDAPPTRHQTHVSAASDLAQFAADMPTLSPISPAHPPAPAPAVPNATTTTTRPASPLPPSKLRAPTVASPVPRPTAPRPLPTASSTDHAAYMLDLETQLDAARRVASGVKDDLATAKRTITELTSTQQHILAEMDRLAERSMQLERQCAQAKAKHARTKERYEHQMMVTAKLQTELDEVAGHVDEWKRLAEDREREVMDLEQQLDEYRAEASRKLAADRGEGGGAVDPGPRLADVPARSLGDELMLATTAPVHTEVDDRLAEATAEVDRLRLENDQLRQHLVAAQDAAKSAYEDAMRVRPALVAAEVQTDEVEVMPVRGPRYNIETQYDLAEVKRAYREATGADMTLDGVEDEEEEGEGEGEGEDGWLDEDSVLDAARRSGVPVPGPETGAGASAALSPPGVVVVDGAVPRRIAALWFAAGAVAAALAAWLLAATTASDRSDWPRAAWTASPGGARAAVWAPVDVDGGSAVGAFVTGLVGPPRRPLGPGAVCLAGASRTGSGAGDEGAYTMPF